MRFAVDTQLHETTASKRHALFRLGLARRRLLPLEKEDERKHHDEAPRHQHEHVEQRDHLRLLRDLRADDSRGGLAARCDVEMAKVSVQRLISRIGMSAKL